ncbi:MAG: MqnA/MqnD/SBP family protein [Arcobacteraceae bacterium]
MIFAKIDYINLLPFYVFIKQNLKSSQDKQIINYRKSYPSKINKDFKKRIVDAAFISSIKSKKCRCLDIGIVAKKDVMSVISIAGTSKNDYQSDTSNVLADILNIKGEILIGDKALHFYHNNDKSKITDLAKVWNQIYNLPFVFARLCTNKKLQSLEQVAKKFVNKKVFIPQYILKQYVKKTGITENQIKNYLAKITYKIDHKEKLALNKFFQLAKKEHKTQGKNK